MRPTPYGMFFISLLFLAMADHGGKYPINEFASPVKRDFKLSGTFGELRTNHFHAGLDIKAEHGIAGDPVYASYQGFISRIKVEEFGYGNAIYIEHPNGFTTVYAHLDKFAPEIEAYVKQEQYRSESFIVDIYPPRTQFPLQKQQLIGIMGNTGSSFGAHLHFEIRHTKGQVPINPLHFGFQIVDRKPPVLQHLIVYEYDNNGNLLQSKILQPKFKSTGQYEFLSPIELSSPRVSFGLRTYDGQDGTTNQNGVYSIQCSVDDDPSFAFALDEIAFDQTRYLNAHIDYRQKINQDKYFHRCHPLEGNKLPIYYTGTDKGVIYINGEIPRSISMKVADFSSNVSTLNFKVIRNPDLILKSPARDAAQTFATPEQVSILSSQGIQVVWPAGSFYEKTPLRIEVIPSDGLDSYSPHYAVSPVDAPVHYYFDINIEGLAVPTHLQDKVFIARCDLGGSIINCGGKWIGNNLSTGARQIGTYAIMADTIPPSIATLHFGDVMTGWSRMAFKISDNFRIRDRGRDLLYDAWIDDQWILMSLDGKTGILTHHFDGRIPPGKHQFKLKVIDDRGNETVLEKTFTL